MHKGYFVLENTVGRKALVSPEGEQLTNFEYHEISYNEEKKGFQCNFSGEIKIAEDGWEEIDENGNLIYEKEPFSKFIPMD